MESCVKVWVGGNIGTPMIDYLDEIEPEDWVVLELSSFQLEQMTISPNVAVVLNITPNHLDRHRTCRPIPKRKRAFWLFRISHDIAILNRDDSGSSDLKEQVKGTIDHLWIQ